MKLLVWQGWFCYGIGLLMAIAIFEWNPPHAEGIIITTGVGSLIFGMILSVHEILHKEDS